MDITQMNITKNDKDIIVCFNAKLFKTRHYYFTHILRVKHDTLNASKECKQINNIIEKHFDLITCDSVSEDEYKINFSSLDEDQESGLLIEYKIIDLEYQRVRVRSGEIFVFFAVKLSNKKQLTF